MSGLFPDRLPQDIAYAPFDVDDVDFSQLIAAAGRSPGEVLAWHRDMAVSAAGAVKDFVLDDWLDVEDRRRPAARELLAASFGAGRYVENFNAASAAEHEAYRRRIEAVRAVTGAELDNPVGRGARNRAEWERMNGEFGGDATAFEAEKKRAFEAELRALAEKFPMARGQILGPVTMQQQALDISRQAQRRFEQAMADPALDGSMITRFAGSVSGYLGAGVYDPVQVVTAFAGAGPSLARTVTARIAQVVATEAALNAGVETALRARAREYRAEAGLPVPTLGEDLTQIGVAALFGGVVGGAAQGAREYARAMEAALARQLSAEAVGALERAFDGWAAPGDAKILREEIAPALGRALTPEEEAQLARAIDEDALDDDYLRAVGDAFGLSEPDEIDALGRAALRYAQDPDNHLPPELVAEQMKLPADEPRFMTADDYIAMYDLGERLDPVADAREGIAARLAPEPETAGLPLLPDDPETLIRPDNPVEPQTREAFEAALRDSGLKPLPIASASDEAAPAARASEPGEYGFRVAEEPADDMPMNLIPLETRDGDRRLGRVNDAFAMADESDDFADLIEACRV